MSIEGIWTGEVYGPFGWDNRGVFVLENGRIVGGHTVGPHRVLPVFSAYDAAVL